MEIIKRIIEIKEEVEKREAELKKLKAEFADMEPQVINYMEAEGLQKVTIDDRTVYVKRQVWASLDRSNSRALEILRDNGLGDFIEEKVNSQRISAYVREVEKDGDIPPWCHAALNITEKYNVGLRRV